MAKGIYTPQRLIGSTSASNKIYGSTKTGTPVAITDSTDPAQIQPSTLEDGVLGYTVLTGTDVKAPPMEEENSKNLGMTQNIQYLLQHLQQWRSDQDYHLSNQDTCLVGTDIYKSLINNNINYVPASNPSQWQYLGNLQLATQTEVFNKDNTKPITANSVYNDLRLNTFSIANSVTGLTQTIPTGNELLDGSGSFVSGYNLCTNMTSGGETSDKEVAFTYKNISNVTQTTVFDNTNKVFLMPSNLYTFNSTRKNYLVRITNIGITIGASLAGNNCILALRLIRLNFNINNQKIIARKYLKYSDDTAGSIYNETIDFITFVSGETDPFVTGGFYVDIIRSNKSTGSPAITVNSANITIFNF